ncbi:MAG: sulfurtransferase TusA family protein [Alicyclobacillus sp.]|nr:sulfurtransferase TusA family protein [Alicyclobacillus sp.]
MQADVIIDAKGLSCPMPIVKAKKAMEGLQPGQIMQLESTDKGSVNDFQSWVKRTNNELVLSQ